MALLITNCPRCGCKQITFDVKRLNEIKTDEYEAFSICRCCNHSTVFVIYPTSMLFDTVISSGVEDFPGPITDWVHILGFVSSKDIACVNPPEYVPSDIAGVFDEGAKCLSIGCFNAAATMFRLCIDISTRKMLPEPSAPEPKPNVRRSLGLRLAWLFNERILPEELKELSLCVKEDGNDGAHEGTLTMNDADDLLDFTTTLLERLYTEPERLRLAKKRREERRNPSTAPIGS
ncbi:DUF4145 domain-containing protein [bacterium]|nr:DUF4145 domain-containing protein [bacterium]